MKPILFFIFTNLSLFIHHASYGQNSKTIDSLLKVIKSDISDKQKINTYLELAYKYQDIDSVNTTKYINKALDLSTKITYNEGKIRALNRLAEYITKHGHYQEVEKLYNRALKTSKLSKHKAGEGMSLEGLGRLYQLLGNYNKALEYHFKALKIQQKIEDKSSLSTTYHTIGNLYLLQENNEKALEYYFKSLKIKENLNDKSGKANAYVTIGITYEKQKKYELTHKYYQKALDIHLELDNLFGLATSYNNFGMLYKAEKKYKKAIESARKSLSFFEKIGIKAYTAYPILTIAEVYVAQKKWKLAKNYLEKGLNISKETSNIDNIKIASKWLALVEKELGNYKKAYEYHVVFKQMADSLQNDEQSQKIIRLEMNYEFEQEKDSLQFANQVEKIALKQDIEQRKVTQITTFISLALLLLLLLTLFFFLRSKMNSNRILSKQSQELKIKNEEILQQAEEIRTLNQILENDLDKTSKELLLKNEKLEEYAYHNSHHTRAPIVNLLGLISILNTENIDADTNFILEKIKESSQELDNITRKMNRILEKGDFFTDKNKYSNKGLNN